MSAGLFQHNRPIADRDRVAIGCAWSGKDTQLNILTLLLLVISGHSAGGQAEVDAPPPAQLQRPGLWIADTAFSPADIASVTLQWDTFSGEPNVLITFSETGRAKFERLQRGRVEQVLEISIDGTIVSSPVLREFISGGQVTISGGMTEAEAAALTRRLTPSRRY